MKSVLKQFGHLVAMLLTSPCALTSHLEGRLNPRSEILFRLWGDVFSVCPGLPGAYLRRAYYCWTLESCSPRCHLSFGTIFSHRKAIIEAGVYVGTYALMGEVILRSKSLIGSRASLISGGAQHQLNTDGEWIPTTSENLQRIEIGENVWLGEACVVAASVGRGSMVAVGSVVVSKVPAGIMVAGNPARFVKKLTETGSLPQQEVTQREDEDSGDESSQSTSSAEDLIYD